MGNIQCGRVDSDSLDEFARVMSYNGSPRGVEGESEKARINLDQDAVKNGLGQLVLTVVKLLHELLERQAIRRMESGSLTDDQIERLGVTLMRQAQEIDRLRKDFGLEEEDLNLDLGPLGKLL
jgi:hypothetical protein